MDCLPIVSVYIPTKNRLELLKRAVQSVFDQKYLNIELIVVDDGSTDGSREYLAELERLGKLKLMLLPVSMGACVARNLAISSAGGEFVTGLDDDDYFIEHRISDFVKHWNSIAHSDRSIAGLFQPTRLLLPQGEELVFTGKEESADALKSQNRVGTNVFAPKAHFIGAGLFDPAMPCWQDWDLWRRMSELYGDFVGGGNASYVWDMSTVGGHITNKPEFMIRHGYNLFSHKARLRSMRDRAGPIDTLSLYPQVHLSVSELGSLLASGRGKAVLKYLSRKVFGDDRSSKIRLSLKSRKRVSQ